MGKGSVQTFLKRKHIDDPRIYEKMLNIANLSEKYRLKPQRDLTSHSKWNICYQK